MRILALTRYGPLSASSRLRILQYLPALHEAGIDVTPAPLLNDKYLEALYAGRRAVDSIAVGYVRRLRALLATRRYDVVWVAIECLPWLPALVELALLPRRVPLVMDYDDAWFHRYDAHSSALVRQILGSKIAKVMRRAALVTAGNPYISEYARGAGARRIEELPTVVDLARYANPARRAASETVVVGWMGSPSTAQNLRILKEPLEALSRRHMIRCIAVGARAEQVSGTPFEAIRWSEHTESEAISNFDIGVMPLIDEPFERGKCGYKLIQYMACGLPVVASPVGVNREIVRLGVNGELAASGADWERTLERLVGDVEARRRMGEAGRKRVEDWYSLQVQAPRLIGMLKSLSIGVG